MAGSEAEMMGLCSWEMQRVSYGCCWVTGPGKFKGPRALVGEKPETLQRVEREEQVGVEHRTSHTRKTEKQQSPHSESPFCQTVVHLHTTLPHLSNHLFSGFPGEGL